MRSGQGFADSLVLVVFLHECVPSAGSFVNFNAPDGVNNKIHAVIIDECVDGKFDILLNLVNGWILPDPTERTVCIVFTRNLGSSVSIWHLSQTNVKVSDFAIGYSF